MNASGRQLRRQMRPTTPRENAKLVAGAVTAVVATGMLFIVVLAVLMAG
jgi:hypothetical protein